MMRLVIIILIINILVRGTIIIIIIKKISLKDQNVWDLVNESCLS